MSALTLARWQDELSAALVAADGASAPSVLTARAADRFRVYRNNLYHGLSEQLGAAFPCVRRVVGTAFFSAMARAFLQHHLPRSRSLALFGAAFPDFLASFEPAKSVPYLTDLARLERAHLEARHAADCAPLAPSAAAALGTALATARFVAHPAARLVRSPHPVVDLWRANHAPTGDDRSRRIQAQAQTAIVTRPSLRVRMRALDAADAVFAAALLDGEDLTRAADRATRESHSFDPATAFQGLLADGCFTRVTASHGATRS